MGELIGISGGVGRKKSRPHTSTDDSARRTPSMIQGDWGKVLEYLL